MKNLKNYLLLPLVATLLASLTACESDLEKVVYCPEDSKAAVLASIENAYTLLAADEEKTAIEFRWSAPQATYPAAFTSVIEMAVKGTSFANPMVLASLKGDTIYQVTVKELNAKLTELLEKSGKEVEATDVEFRLSSVVSSAMAPLYSNILSTRLTPYSGEREYPKVWIIGSYCDWKHENSQFLFSFAENTTYEAVIDFGTKAASGFKVTGVGAWSDDSKNWGRDNNQPAPEAEAASVQLVAGGGSGNLVNYSKRFYHLTFDTQTLMLKVDYAFDFIGLIGLNGDWGNDIELNFDKAKQVFYADVTATADTEFKVRTDKGWARNWGGKDGNLIPNASENTKLAAGSYRIYVKLNNQGAPTYEASAKDFGK